MLIRNLLLVVLTLGSLAGLRAQTCTTLGQTPSTAFPVCGTDTFSQANVPICGNTRIPVGCNDGAQYSDKNPFWYQFTCFTAGTLGFVITPNTLSDDYDWQLFDITGKNPNDVFTDPSLFVSGNWSGEGGLTGASAAGNTNLACAGFGQPLFNKMPTLIQGHQYLLLVSHFTDSQSGYKLSFGGGTASITDPKVPQLQSAIAGCGGLQIGIKLNKKMKCSSLALDGSDFTIAPAAANVLSASAVSCSSGFDMDSVVITLSNAIPAGNYNLQLKTGSDNNTLLDNCNRDIPAGQSIPFTVFPVQPTPLDSISPVGCAPGKLQLVFRRSINCSSIAANGSDFILNGPVPVAVTAAAGNCGTNNNSTIIQLTLATPLQVGGIYQVQLVTGSDGNTIIDDCGQQTPPGSFVNLTVADTVSADFSYQLALGCTSDTIRFLHDGRNGVNRWNWEFDNQLTSTIPNPVQVYTVFGLKTVSLKVSNGVCSDSVTQNILLDNTLKASFDAPDILCPGDLAVFRDNSVGNIASWNWDFGNGNSSGQQHPPDQQYPPVTTAREKNYTVRLIVQNNNNCYDTVTRNLKVVNTCRIAVPNAFTPNGDGRNDYLYPLNAWKADNLVFKVYNRYGQVVFETRDWTKKWDGTINGNRQETGVYVWVLQYIDHDTGKQVFQKGTAILIR